MKTSTHSQGFLEKTVILGKNRSEQGKRETKYEMDRPHIKSYRHESTGAEQGCKEQDIVDMTHSLGHEQSEPTQWHLTGTCVTLP